MRRSRRSSRKLPSSRACWGSWDFEARAEQKNLADVMAHESGPPSTPKMRTWVGWDSDQRSSAARLFHQLCRSSFQPACRHDRVRSCNVWRSSRSIGRRARQRSSASTRPASQCIRCHGMTLPAARVSPNSGMEVENLVHDLPLAILLEHGEHVLKRNPVQLSISRRTLAIVPTTSIPAMRDLIPVAGPFLSFQSNSPCK